MRLPEDETILNVYRKRRGFTHRQLAEVAGATPSAVQRWCLPRSHSGHRRPNTRAAERLRAWSGGEVHAGNYADPWSPATPPPPEGVRRADAVPADTQ